MNIGEVWNDAWRLIVIMALAAIYSLPLVFAIAYFEAAKHDGYAIIATLVWLISVAFAVPIFLSSRFGRWITEQ